MKIQCDYNINARHIDIKLREINSEMLQYKIEKQEENANNYFKLHSSLIC